MQIIDWSQTNSNFQQKQTRNLTNKFYRERQKLQYELDKLLLHVLSGVVVGTRSAVIAFPVKCFLREQYIT